VPGVEIIGKRKAVIGIEPSVVGMASFIAASNGVHG
jgi:hypothetical protein